MTEIQSALDPRFTLTVVNASTSSRPRLQFRINHPDKQYDGAGLTVPTEALLEALAPIVASQELTEGYGVVAPPPQLSAPQNLHAVVRSRNGTIYRRTVYGPWPADRRPWETVAGTSVTDAFISEMIDKFDAEILFEGVGR